MSSDPGPDPLQEHLDAATPETDVTPVDLEGALNAAGNALHFLEIAVFKNYPTSARVLASVKAELVKFIATYSQEPRVILDHDEITKVMLPAKKRKQKTPATPRVKKPKAAGVKAKKPKKVSKKKEAKEAWDGAPCECEDCQGWCGSLTEQKFSCGTC